VQPELDLMSLRELIPEERLSEFDLAVGGGMEGGGVLAGVPEQP